MAIIECCVLKLIMPSDIASSEILQVPLYGNICLAGDSLAHVPVELRPLPRNIRLFAGWKKIDHRKGYYQ
jgi:hypothetical protein